MKDLYSFLYETSINSSFNAELSKRGGFITFSNSGRRGSIKYFQIGLDSILQTLKDILNNLVVFHDLTEYDEKPWRDNGSEYFNDPVANANSTVQTKPLFSTLSKVIIWGNQPRLNHINPDENIVLDELSLSNAINNLEIVANSFRPQETNPKEMKMTDNPLQQIFYGAPGTGKSHAIKIKSEAAEKDGRVFRTTFHPDSDYSTFVGCYKPSMKSIDKIWSVEELAVKLKEVKNTGATYPCHKFAAQYWRSLKNLSAETIKQILKASDIPESMQVEIAKGVAIGQEYLNKEEDGKIVYTFIPQAFTKAYIAAWNTEENVFLIIEEINRGNCAQIFGDLFQLLDRGQDGFSEYPIYADTDLGNYIAEELKNSTRNDFPECVKEGKKLVLPSNLYIWATMNTSDQSLFPIDSAFKRRWEWRYVPIDTKKENWKIEVGTSRYSWTSFLEKVNDEILTDETAEDKHLGFYFCKAENHIISKETFVAKVLFYLWNDVFKIYGIPAVIGSSKDWAFTKFYNADASVNEEKVKALMEKLQIKDENGSESVEKEGENE